MLLAKSSEFSNLLIILFQKLIVLTKEIKYKIKNNDS